MAASLLLPESIRVAKRYAELQDWSAVRSHLLSQNLLQARRVKTGQRLYQKIASR
ncbi:BrxA family protein [Spirulina sp. CCNP1310]|uniref:BrxA family protein n=1 Tax=Spirulina sp. CCNP1310 TaxID=3110249 RepID=UPI002B21FAB5|nr:BrxA family protein [Spirulina sp. CCNP1310]MEA5420868.1 BrxA family protein [Spirulina sp. CCNP1310]